jgi:hypothetical protein
MYGRDHIKVIQFVDTYNVICPVLRPSFPIVILSI